MLRTKLSKLKQICVTALIPKIYKESKTIKKDLDKGSTDYFSKATHKKYKSTDSSSKDDSSYAKRKAIIDKCFPKKPAKLYEKGTAPVLLSKDEFKFFNTEDKNTSLKPTVTENGNIDNKVSEHEQVQNTEVQNIAAKVKEVKLAYDVIHTDNALHLKTDAAKDSSGMLENKNEEMSIETSRLLQLQMNKTPHLDISETNVSTLLQHRFVQTIPENTGDSKNPTPGINVENSRDGINIPKESEALQKNDIHVVASIIETDKVPELQKNANVHVTTAKIEEEKLTQKIDVIDETPHVEATPPKVEEFNFPPKILGYDFTPHLFTNEFKNDNLTNEVEKFHIDTKVSQVLKDRTNDNNNIVFDISDTHVENIPRDKVKGTGKEIKLDNFYPFHLDTVPIVTTDTRDYKDEWNRKYLSAGFKNLLLDIPAILDPYDMQAIPFYQYVSKEKIILREIRLDETPIQKPSSVEVAAKTEVNAPMNEDIILKREEIENIHDHVLKELENGNIENRKIATVNGVEPLFKVETRSVKSTEKPCLSESDVLKLLEYKNVLTVKRDALGNIKIPNISPSKFSVTNTGAQYTKSSPNTVEAFPLKTPKNKIPTVLTSETPIPTDGYNNPMGFPDSGHPSYQTGYGYGYNKQSDENRTDTAISAHQNADEYFPTSNLSSFMGDGIQQMDYEVADNSVSYTGVFDIKCTYCDAAEESSTDNFMSQSISYYSTFPQLTDFLDKYKNFPDGSTQSLKEKETLKYRERKKQSVVQVSLNKEIDLSDETLPLSILLRRVRERSRMEYITSVKVEPEIAKKPCIPPLDRSKPKTGLSPKPCQPKPKEESKCPSPCKPEKKDPCVKFTPFLLNIIVSSSIDISIPSISRYDQMYTYLSLLKEIAYKKLKHLNNILSFVNIKSSGDEIKVVLARDFKPWVPIPSWPIPELEKGFVCPKEGCKLPAHPVRSNTDKPCLGIPKKISPSKTVNFAKFY